jgi:hypothetical protein
LLELSEGVVEDDDLVVSAVEGNEATVTSADIEQPASRGGKHLFDGDALHSVLILTTLPPEFGSVS